MSVMICRESARFLWKRVPDQLKNQVSELVIQPEFLSLLSEGIP